MLVSGRVTWICLLSSLPHSIPQHNVGSSVATDNKPFKKSHMSIPIVTCSYCSSMFFLLRKNICFPTFMVNLSLADSFINDRLWHLLPYWISVCWSLVFPPCLICGALDVCLSTVKSEDKMGSITAFVERFEKPVVNGKDSIKHFEKKQGCLWFCCGISTLNKQNWPIDFLFCHFSGLFPEFY